MNTDDSILIVEINETNYIFVAGFLNEDNNFQISEKTIVNSYGFSKNKFTNLDLVKQTVKKNIEIIENKLNCIFKEVTIIIDNFYFQKEHKTEYDLTITSKKEKNIISKDSKGDPAIFELVINVKYSVKKDNKILIENELNEKNTYNNIADKFELKNYENNIINNLSSRMSGIIMSSIRNKNQ